MNKVILYIATSTDGFIADEDGGVGWLPHPKNDRDLEIVGYKKLMERIDTIVMGSNSFEQIASFGEWAWPDKHTYIFSSQDLELPHANADITVTDETPREFMEKVDARENGKDIWLCGGAQLAQSFARDGLIDEIVLTIVPIKLGKGIELGVSLDDFTLQDERDLPDDMKQKVYARKDKKES